MLSFCSNGNCRENGIHSYLYFLADKSFYLLTVGDFHKTVDFALGKLLADQNYESNRLPIESEKKYLCLYRSFKSIKYQDHAN